MSGSSRPISEGSEEASLDSTLDEMVRAVAHAPPQTPPLDPHGGTRWGEAGRYVVERRLGRGGMGTVYLAADTLLGRQVALKVLDFEGPREDPGRRSRLVREARLAAGLEHERIARVYDVAEHDGTTFVAMEYVRGANLRASMGEVATPAQVATVLKGIAEGLAVLHAGGVVHRDLKPENVMLSTSGGIKLLDFGLAGILTGTLESNRLPPTTSQGAGGPGLAAPAPDGVAVVGNGASAFYGTLGYMAPEQCAGERADARADVFAFGVIVYELVTGERPFRGAMQAALRQAIAEGPLPFDPAAWSQYPAGLSSAVSRMLHFDRAARFADGAAIVRALDEIFKPPQAEAARPRRLTYAAFALTGLAALGALAIPYVGRTVALRRALARPPPSGMALINEGTLTVGQPATTVNRQCAELGTRCNPKVMNYQIPAVKVTVPPFYLDTHEVTNREMAALLDKLRGSLYVERDEDDHTPRYVRFNAGLGNVSGHLVDLQPTMGGIEHEPGVGYRARAGREEWPANQVTWFGARMYCSSIGKRLPTENEWEAAARGHSDRPFPWGATRPRCGAVVVPSDEFLPMDPGCPKLGEPLDVGTAVEDVSPEGVHDLGGNVSEWVDTAYVEGDRAGTPPANETESPRVIRGGSFFFSLLARTSLRNKRPPAYLAYDVGFRCASDLVPPTSH